MSKKVLALFMAVLMLMTAAVPTVFAASFGVKEAEYKGHKYVLVNESMTWSQAKAYCESKGGYLATITSQGEQDVIKNLIKGAAKHFYWLGATDEAKEGVWTWITGEPFTYLGPTTTLDNYQGNENYMEIFTNIKGDKSKCGYWNDANNECYLADQPEFYNTKYTGLICEFGDSTMPINENSTSFNGHTYTALDLSLNWSDAVAFCKAQGGNLATITSEAEQIAVEETVKTGKKYQYWLGATDEVKENNWKWITGEPFTYWADCKKFDNAFGREHYLQMLTSNRWDKSYFGYWNDAPHNNIVSSEKDFYSHSTVGLVLELGTNEMPCEKSSKVPIIYIKGRTNIYNTKGKPLFNGTNSYITDVMSKRNDLLRDAVITNSWNRYCNTIVSDMEKKFEDFRLNEAGEVTNGSGIKWSWEYDKLPHVQGDMFTYLYEYDCRLDPCDTADDLHDYIEAIKEVTGSETVNIVSRCLGSNIATAYFAEYGWDDVETAVFYSSAALGYDYISDMFTGDICFKSDSLDQYCDQRLDEEDIPEAGLRNAVKSFVSFLNKSGLMVYGTSTANNIVNTIMSKTADKLLRATFGTCPGYWSMVNDSHYEAAKKLVFGDEADTTYKELVEKIDNYHYNVMNNTVDMLKQMDADGVKINVICKYGLQTPPIVRSSTKLSDNTIDVYSQSFYGATCANTGHTLTKQYLADAKKSGADRFISPDKMIDSSTALFPDRTWYIKNYVHDTFYDCFNDMLMDMCYSDTNMTVDSDERYPQYLVYDEALNNFYPFPVEEEPTVTPTPGTGTGTDTPSGTTSSNLLIRILQRLIYLIKYAFGIR